MWADDIPLCPLKCVYPDEFYSSFFFFFTKTTAVCNQNTRRFTGLELKTHNCWVRLCVYICGGRPVGRNRTRSHREVWLISGPHEEKEVPVSWLWNWCAWIFDPAQADHSGTYTHTHTRSAHPRHTPVRSFTRQAVSNRTKSSQSALEGSKWRRNKARKCYLTRGALCPVTWHYFKCDAASHFPLWTRTHTQGGLRFSLVHF